ncbi:DUF2238 domain-containing protein [Cohnella suwonensis]|uniref:DUF2238 domain-containing protein n=1 Tax=Cohnella suwonensis TaxID=696072 RepID=A0ABW0M1Y5_9BACL
MPSHNRSPLFPALLLIGFLIVLSWSVIKPADYGTWFAEVTPALVIVIVLVATYRIKEAFRLKRNNFDRFGHAFQGIIPAFGIKELLIRLQVIRRSKWLTAIAVSFTLAVSSVFEIAEFAAYKIIGGNANEFLGMQGDPLDAQWDMLWALIGVVVGLLLLGKLHDRKIREL